MNQKAFVLWGDAEDGDCVSSIGHIDVTRGVIRPALRGTVPLFAQMSRVPRNRDNVPRFRKIRKKHFYFEDFLGRTLDYFRRKSVLNRSIRLVENHLPDSRETFPA